MKNLFALLMVTVLAAPAFGVDPSRKLAFEKNNGSVWVSNLDGSSAKKIAAGVDPDISPDGTALAFTKDDTPENSSPIRHIAVADVASGKITVFKDIPSNNSFGPEWSPDGKSILFYTHIENSWDVALINPDGSNFRIFKKGGPDSEAYFSGAWARDGKSIYAQDLTKLYQFALDGTVIKQWPLEKLFTEGDMDSNMRFDVSPDGKSLLVDLNSGAEHDRPDWDGPAPSVWSLDLTTEKAQQLTPQFSWEPHWIDAQEFLFISQGEKEKQPSIYRMSVGKKDRKLVVKNARTPSVSHPIDGSR